MRTSHYASVAALIGLIALCLAWELWLAPLRPGGSWVVLKVIPLLAAVRGLIHARRYTFQWLSLLALAYLSEGLVRGWSDTGMSQYLAWAETGLAGVLFVATVLHAWLSAPSRAENLVTTTARSAD
ncbi:MAG: DUF2069 domain-containing protein [Burkholderiales bacterium]